MKKQIFAGILTSAMVLSMVTSSDASTQIVIGTSPLTQNEDSHAINATFNTLTKSATKVELELKYFSENGEYFETATLTGVTSSGEVVWTRESGNYISAQVDRIEEILTNNSVYYYCEGTDMYALKIETGEEIWKSTGSFGGMQATYFDEKRNYIYLAGYLGPDLVVVSAKDGTIIHTTESFKEKYIWPVKIDMVNDKIGIYFASTPYHTYLKQGSCDFYISPETFEIYESESSISVKEISQILNEYFNRVEYKGDDKGTFVIFDSEFDLQGHTYHTVLRYQISNEEAQAYIDSMGFPPSANTYKGDVTVDTTTGDVHRNDVFLFNIWENNNSQQPTTPTFSSWATSHIEKAQTSDLIVDSLGKDYTSNITRSQIADLLVNMVEKYTGTTLTSADSSTFTDTSDTAILKANEAGIISGMGDGTFAPNSTATREQIAMMIYKTILVMEEATGTEIVTKNTTLGQYNDSSDVSDWALEAVAILANNGIMEGTGDGNLSPLATASIEQGIILNNALFELNK